jgi:hypothetical protein
LFEYLRLKWVSASVITIARVDPYITGASIAAVCTCVAVGLFFLGRYKAVAVVSAATVGILLVYKVLTIGW